MAQMQLKLLKKVDKMKICALFHSMDEINLHAEMDPESGERAGNMALHIKIHSQFQRCFLNSKISQSTSKRGAQSGQVGSALDTEYIMHQQLPDIITL
jgi:hypothetical protein